MKKHFTRVLAVALVIAMMIPCLILPASAASYRTGGNTISDSYKSSRYYKNFQKVTLTDDDRTNLLAVAISQLGYNEGTSKYDLGGTNVSKGNFTEFNWNAGNWAGTYSYAWCASFVSWCLYQSGCTDQATWKAACRYNEGNATYIWKEYSCSAWVRQLTNHTNYYRKSAARGGTYTPMYGDIIFFRDSKGGLCHVGIVLYVSGGRVYTIEGNTSDASGVVPEGGGVFLKSYSLNYTRIHGYAKLPYDSDNVQDIDYSGKNPTTGLYMTDAVKYLYKDANCTTRATYSNGSYVNISRFRMIEATDVVSGSNGKALKVTWDGVTGYVSVNSTDRVIQLTKTGSSSGGSTTPSTPVTSNGSLVAGKQYTITGTTTYKGSGLTDGVYSENTSDGTWLGLGDANRFSGQYVNIDYDLGDKYSLTDASIHVGINSTNGIGRPYDLQLQVSDDKTNWETAANFTLPTGTWENGTYTFSASCVGYAGRYIRIKAMNSGWFFVNEIVVNGTKYTGEVVKPTESESIVHGKKPTVTGTPKYDGRGTVTDGIYSNNLEDGTWLGLNDNNRNAQGWAHFDFDLGDNYVLSGAKIHIGYNGAVGIGIPYEVTIFVSDNGSTWTPTDIFDTSAIKEWAEDSSTTNKAKTFTISKELLGFKARYVRVAAVNSGLWFVSEFELYGDVAADTGETNVISGKVPTITGTTIHNALANVTDGKVSTNTEDGTWLGLDDNNRFDGNYVNVDFALGGKYAITRAKVYFAYTNKGGIGRPYDLIVQISDDGKNWADIGYFDLPKDLSTGYLTFEVSNMVGTGSYLRFKAVNAGWFFINELEAYGTVATDDVVEVLRGDVNGDGQLKTTDYFMLKSYILGTLNTSNLPEGVAERADYNGDGKVNVADYMLLKKDFLNGNI